MVNNRVLWKLRKVFEKGVGCMVNGMAGFYSENCLSEPRGEMKRVPELQVNYMKNYNRSMPFLLPSTLHATPLNLISNAYHDIPRRSGPFVDIVGRACPINFVSNIINIQ